MDGQCTTIAALSSTAKPAALAHHRPFLPIARPTPRLFTATVRDLEVTIAETLLRSSHRMEDDRALTFPIPSAQARDLQAYLPKHTSMVADPYLQGQ
jgi:hypothetical protein